MNKRAETGDQIFLFYFLFILLIIVGGIVIGDFILSGKPYDLRAQDSEILSGKIIECLKNTEALTENKITNLFETCNFYESTFENGLIVSLNTKDKFLFRYGNVVACGLQDLNAEYPKCKSSYIHLNIDGKDSEVYVLTGSNLQSEAKK